MARFQFSRPGYWDYPAIGLRNVITGDVIDATYAPDTYWALVDPGTPITKTPGPGFTPVETYEGVVAKISDGTLYRGHDTSLVALSVPATLGTGFSLDVTDPTHPILNVDLSESPWIEVNSGNPAPAFQNSAANLGSGYANVAFVKLRNGMVQMRGHVVCAATQIFTLPVGYRPPANLILPTFLNTGFGTFIVNSNGVVIFNGTAPSTFGCLNGSFWAGP